MLLRRRIVVALTLAGLLGLAGVLLMQPHARASGRLSYASLNKIQRRIISQTLASALGPRSAPNAAPSSDQGGGPDGAPFARPKSYSSASGSSGVINYFPSASGKCSARLGGNVKVNQNCLNVTDPDLQGRGQANNEPAIAQDPFAPGRIVASDNNYVRGHRTCGGHFSLDGG